LYFSPSELKWSSEPGGNHTASIDVAAAAFDENGLALAPINTTFALKLNAEKYGSSLKKGMVYAIHFPVSRPGPYVIRAALRDPATDGVGSTDAYVDVPDVANGHLALSGIVLEESAAETPGVASPLRSEAPHPEEDLAAGAARRTFSRGASLVYDYEILNARTGDNQHPELEVETRLFHEGERIHSERTTLTPSKTLDPLRFIASGHWSISREMAPGEYVLQVIVTDKLARAKFSAATQFVNFEIEP